jgi:CheY-like chemotaxis protein
MEDDDDDAWLLKRAVAKHGISNPVYVVPNGEEGIAYLAGYGRYADRAAHPVPCIIITDLNMPRKGGLEVLDWLRNHPEYRVVPTIVLTSSKAHADISKAYGFGANSYMVKPTESHNLERLVRLIHEYWTACERPA